MNARVLDTEAEVETPEQICFSYRIAGPSHRLMAYGLDLLLRGVLLFAVMMIFETAGVAADKKIAEATMGIILVVLFMLEWGYFVFFETLLDGQSPGKRAMGLRVVNRDGYGIQLVDSVLRNLLRAADFLPWGYALGFLSMIGDGCFRRLGDRVAGTMVVVEQRQKAAPPLQVVPPPSAEELAAFTGRPRLARADLDALELFLRRRGTLGVARERELAEMIAPVYRNRADEVGDDAVRFLALLYSRATGRDNEPRPPSGRRR